MRDCEGETECWCEEGGDCEEEEGGRDVGEEVHRVLRFGLGWVMWRLLGSLREPRGERL